MNLFQKFLRLFKRNRYPEHLYVRGRITRPTTYFNNNHKLYREYDLKDIEDDERIGLNNIRAHNLSCNWGEYSEPEDLRFKKNAKRGAGCYSFKVASSRYDNFATPVHDPIPDTDDAPNYAHVEVRELRDGEDINFEPPKDRNKKKSTGFKVRRKLWRNNLRNSLTIEIPAT